MLEEEDVKSITDELSHISNDACDDKPINKQDNENAVGPQGDVADSSNKDKDSEINLVNGTNDDEKKNESEYFKSTWFTEESMTDEEKNEILNQSNDLKSTFQSRYLSNEQQEDLLSVRVQLRENLSQLIIRADLNWLFANNIEYELWTILYKQPIDSPNKTRDKKLNSASLIIEGKSYYRSLIHCLFKRYNKEIYSIISPSAPSEDNSWTTVLWPPTECEKYLPQKLLHQLKEDLEYLHQSEKDKNDSDTSFCSVNLVTKLFQDCLVHLGDLYRYESNSNTNNSARCFYLWSAAVNPDYALPHYLLAKLELNKNRLLASAYHFTRCLLAVGSDSKLERDCLLDLDQFYDRLTREPPVITQNFIQQVNTGSRKSNQNFTDTLMKAFLQYHAAIYWKKDLFQARTLWVRFVGLLPQHLDRYSSEDLFHMTAVQLYSLHRETNRYKVAEENISQQDNEPQDDGVSKDGEQDEKACNDHVKSSLSTDYTWCKLLLQSTSNLIGALCESCNSVKQNTEIGPLSGSMTPCIVLFLIWYKLALKKGLVHVKSEGEAESGACATQLCVCALPASFVDCINTLSHQYCTNADNQQPLSSNNKTSQQQSNRKRQLQETCSMDQSQQVKPNLCDNTSQLEDLDWNVIQQLPEFVKMRMYFPCLDDIENTFNFTNPSCTEEQRIQALLHLSRVLALHYPQLLALIETTGESKRYHFGIGSQSIAALLTNGASSTEITDSENQSKPDRDKTRLPGQYPRSPSPPEKPSNRRLPGQYPASPPSRKKQQNNSKITCKNNSYYPTNKGHKKPFINPAQSQQGPPNMGMMPAGGFPGYMHTQHTQPYPFNALPPPRFYPPFPPHPHVLQFGKQRHQTGMPRPRFGSPMATPAGSAPMPAGYMSYNQYPRPGPPRNQSWKSHQSRDQYSSHQSSRQPGSYAGPYKSNTDKVDSNETQRHNDELKHKSGDFVDPGTVNKPNPDNINQRQQRVRNRTSSGLVTDNNMNSSTVNSQNDNLNFKITRQKSLSLNLSPSSCPSSPPHNQLQPSGIEDTSKFPGGPSTGPSQPAGLITNPEITRYITQHRSIVTSIESPPNISSDMALSLSPSGTPMINKQALNNQNREQFQKDLPPRFSGSGPSTPLGGPTDSFATSSNNVSSQSVSHYSYPHDNLRGGKNSYQSRNSHNRYHHSGTGNQVFGRAISSHAQNFDSRGRGGNSNNYNNPSGSRSSYSRDKHGPLNHNVNFADKQSAGSPASTLMQVGTWESTAEQFSRMNLHGSGRREAVSSSASARDHVGGANVGSGALDHRSNVTAAGLGPPPSVVSYHSLQAPAHYPTALDMQQLSNMHHALNWFSIPSSSNNTLPHGSSNAGAPQGNVASNTNSLFSMEQYAALAASGIDLGFGSTMDATTASRFGLAAGTGAPNGLPGAGGVSNNGAGEMWPPAGRQFQRPASGAAQSSSRGATDFHTNHFHINSGNDMAAHGPHVHATIHPHHLGPNPGAHSSATAGASAAAGMTHFVDNWLPGASSHPNQSNSGGVALGSNNTVSSNNTAAGGNNPLWHPHPPPDIFPLPLMATDSHPHQPTAAWYTLPAAHFSSPHHPAVLNPGEAALLQHHHHPQQSAGKNTGPLPPHNSAGLAHW